MDVGNDSDGPHDPGEPSQSGETPAIPRTKPASPGHVPHHSRAATHKKKNHPERRPTSRAQRLPKTSRVADERFIVMKWMPGAPSSSSRRDDSEAIAMPSERTAAASSP